MANQDMAEQFAKMMQGNEKATDTTAPLPLDKGLPTQPQVDNGVELDLIEGTWTKRPLEGQKESEEIPTSVVVTTDGQMNPLFTLKKVEKSRQRNLCLTDTQFEKFQKAAVAFGYVRHGKQGKKEANGSAFLQAIIDSELWNKCGVEEVHHG